jgi:hypothetical protein
MSPINCTRIAFIFLFIASALRCGAASLLYIRGGGVAEGQAEVQEAVGFYGLDLRTVSVSSLQDNSDIARAAAEAGLVGVAIDAGALEMVDRAALFDRLAQRKSPEIPVLVLGITSSVPSKLLGAWSGDAVSGCSATPLRPGIRYAFGAVPGVTYQLSGLEAPVALAAHSAGSYESLQITANAERIESLRGEGGDDAIFVRSREGKQTVFFSCAQSALNAQAAAEDLASEFLRVAPAMIFVRFCAGDRSWHSLHYYANFTIDDPWLRQPYGYVDYEGLLQEMLRHRFHTTIAFIPWNYERSQPEVVALFKNHPAQYSIAVHGDNHDHKEFTDYKSKPLAGQIEDLKQALARMDRFSRLTGIAYDRVMIFPHSIAPEPTLAALKAYNFLATVNSTNTPEGTSETLTGVEALRPVTLKFGGFPSVLRYSTGIPVTAEWIAVNQFLGNPLFFYDHSALFANGIDAFDKVADAVNKREPATEWSNLGEIARHLYVVKERNDGDYDVLAFSSDVALGNPLRHAVRFHFEKEESGSQKIEAVTDNGSPVAYTQSQGKLSLVVTVAAGGTGHVVIAYANDLGLSPVNPGHDSLRVELLRRGSDFRDIYLAKAGPGLAFIRFYETHQISPARLIFFVLVVVGVLLCLLLYLRKWIAKSRDGDHGLSASAR